MTKKASTQGFTVIEVLITGLILVVVLGIVSTFLVQQMQLNRTTQARNEVQDKVRQVAEVVAQDLHMAGASRYVDEDGDSSAGVILESCNFQAVLCLSGDDGGLLDTLEVAYVTSLRDAGISCRNVSYKVEDGVLLRSDRLCDPLGPTPPNRSHDYQPFADNILAFDIQYVCSNGATVDYYPDNSDCPKGTGVTYPRTARFTVVGESNMRAPVQGEEEYVTVSGQTVTCGPERVCFAQSREVLMPNLKDQ